MCWIGGANRGPVEDAGGTSGYARLIEALADPADEDHQELSGWYTFATGQDAGSFAPYAFDADALNVRLDGLAKRLWPDRPRTRRSTPSCGPCSGSSRRRALTDCS